MIEYCWLVPLLPLLGAVIAAAGGRWLKDQAHVPVVAGIALAFFASLPLLLNATSPHEVLAYQWINAGDLHVPALFRVDGLTTMMLSMVTFVATLIAIFSVGYMAGESGYPRFFALIGLFVFSMTGLVLSSNYVLTYAFWEGVGACSYLLIGFWYAKPSAAAAAKKAFLVNRVGDVGFAIALFWMWSLMPEHSLSYDNVLNESTIRLLPYAAKVGLPLLLLWAATAKSAQIPLYVWLPDAMEGPTPVSALIHAATMVTAGVYLLARSSLLMTAVPGIHVLIAVIGCLTALLSAAIAVTQTDLKRVLAYSTISQLGYMFMGLGAGIGSVGQLAVVAAMFHLFTHAFFKALLFLGAGSVMHSMGGIIDMRRFSGLRHRMPVTCWTFAIGGLALAGIFPMAGFWSKDEILAALSAASHEAYNSKEPFWSLTYLAVYLVAVFTAFLTAFYTGRAFFKTFFGPEKLPSPDDPEADPEAEAAHGHAHDHAASHEVDPHRPADLPPPTHGATDEPVHPEDHSHEGHLGHESPPVMLNPLIALAICAVLVGMVFGPTGLFAGHLLRTPGINALGHPEHAEHGFDWVTALVGTVAGVAGVWLSWRWYALPSDQPAAWARRLRPLYNASCRKFAVDEIYETIIVRPLWGLARFFKGFFDDYIIDNLIVGGGAWLPRFFGRRYLAPFQNGLVQYYAAATALGVAVLLVILLLV